MSDLRGVSLWLCLLCLVAWHSLLVAIGGLSVLWVIAHPLTNMMAGLRSLMMLWPVTMVLLALYRVAPSLYAIKKLGTKLDGTMWDKAQSILSTKWSREWEVKVRKAR